MFDNDNNVNDDIKSLGNCDDNDNNIDDNDCNRCLILWQLVADDKDDDENDSNSCSALALAQVAGIYFEVSAIHQNFPYDDDDDVEDGDDDDWDVDDDDYDDDDVEDDDDDNMLKSEPKVGVVHKNNKVC